MTLRHTIVASLLACFAAPAFAVGVVGDVAAGKKKAEELKCASCHGDGDKTLDATYPRLSGQYPDYLAKALKEYRSGKRKNAVMAGQAQTLEPKDIDDLAAYYGSLKGDLDDLSKHAR